MIQCRCRGRHPGTLRSARLAHGRWPLPSPPPTATTANLKPLKHRRRGRGSHRLSHTEHHTAHGPGAGWPIGDTGQSMSQSGLHRMIMILCSSRRWIIAEGGAVRRWPGWHSRVGAAGKKHRNHAADCMGYNRLIECNLRERSHYYFKRPYSIFEAT